MKENAKKALQDMKRVREREENVKKGGLEKQLALKLENQRVRENNLRHFGHKKYQASLPWGSDQRRILSSPQNRSQERSSRERSTNSRK